MQIWTKWIQWSVNTWTIFNSMLQRLYTMELLLVILSKAQWMTITQIKTRWRMVKIVTKKDFKPIKKLQCPPRILRSKWKKICKPLVLHLLLRWSPVSICQSRHNHWLQEWMEPHKKELTTQAIKVKVNQVIFETLTINLVMIFKITRKVSIKISIQIWRLQLQITKTSCWERIEMQQCSTWTMLLIKANN